MAIAPYISHFTPREIRTIFSKARRAYTDPGLILLTNPALKEYGRILIITSRKVGNAPERNKIRRRIKALFYQNKLYNKNIDCFVIIKKPGIAYTCSQLDKILSHALS